MGIPDGVARLLLEEHRQRPFAGRILQLGRMHVLFGRNDLSRWADAQGATLAPVDEVGLSPDPVLASRGFLDDVSFFRLLGFSEVESSDVSDWEQPDHIIDLNAPAPAHLEGRFDVVLESGTLQHVFNLPQVLENMHRLVRPGGRLVHGMCASNNHVDHGFYMFCPTLFHDYYEANGYRIEALYVMEFRPYWQRGVLLLSDWRIYDYTPGSLDALSYGGYGPHQTAIFCVVTRTEDATAGRMPQQSVYQRIWQEAERGKASRHTGGEGLLARRDAVLERLPWLDALYTPLKRWSGRLRRSDDGGQQ